MTDQEIKIGTVVALKSGGPKMTVMEKVGKHLACRWFHEGDIKQEVFNPEALFVPKSRPVGPRMVRTITGLES